MLVAAAALLAAAAARPVRDDGSPKQPNLEPRLDLGLGLNPHKLKQLSEWLPSEMHDRRPMAGWAQHLPGSLKKVGGDVEPVHNLVSPDVPAIGPKTASMEDLVLPWGYPLETYPVETHDGYILRLYRIPHGKKNATSANPHKPKPVVLILHGITLASSSFVVMDPESSLGFFLADAGFDVWMFNTRGNTYSRGHRYLRNTDQGYWEFSMDELALIDLPTQIDEVLRLTGQPSLALIGHSQGCTLPLMLLGARPEYNQKVWLLQMLGAVTSPARIAAKFLSQQAKTMSSLLLINAGIGQFMPNSATAQLTSGCSRPESTEWCFNFISFLFYGSSEYMNYKDLFKVGSTWPSTVALRNLLHWSQLWRSNSGIKMFDFGANCSVPAGGPAPYHESCNLAMYGMDVPPSYDLKRVTTKAAVFSGTADTISPESQTELLLSSWSADVVYSREFKGLAHMDFTWSRDPICKPDIITTLWDNVPTPLSRKAAAAAAVAAAATGSANVGGALSPLGDDSSMPEDMQAAAAHSELPGAPVEGQQTSTASDSDNGTNPSSSILPAAFSGGKPADSAPLASGSLLTIAASGISAVPSSH